MAMVVCASGRKDLQILRGQLALLFGVENWSKDTLMMFYLWREGWERRSVGAEAKSYSTMDRRWNSPTNGLFRLGN
jgi:hypothetical protein